MNLQDTLSQIAAFSGLNITELLAYATEDAIGGRDTGEWDSMSTFADEGRIIYALVRALKPRRALEIGVASGGTSTHILAALEANGRGDLYSIDIEPNCGINVPPALMHRWHFVVADALTADLPPADFVFEDGAHTFEFTVPMLERLKALNPRVIMSHDYFTHEVYGGFYVKQAFDQVLPGGLGIKVDGAFTGLGLWVNPHWEAPVEAVEAIEATEPVIVAPRKPVTAKKKAVRRG